MSRYHISMAGSTFVISKTTQEFRNGYDVRKKIAGFSVSASRRMRQYLRSCVADYRFMVTLTYPGCFPYDGRQSKKHLQTLFKRLFRLWGGAEKTYRSMDGVSRVGEDSIFWFMEFQERGAIHYHLFTTERIDKLWLSKAWYEIVGSDDIRHLHAGTRIEELRSGRSGTISYASKYAAKQEQKKIPPNVISAGRFWGVSGERRRLSAANSVGVTNANASSLAESIEYCTKGLETAIVDGDVAILLTKSGCFAAHALNLKGLRALRRAYRTLFDDFMFYGVPTHYEDIYDILEDHSLCH